jgi:hypothetical protein
MVPHADHMVGPISTLKRRFDATLDSMEQSCLKLTIYTPPSAISREAAGKHETCSTDLKTAQ